MRVGVMHRRFPLLFFLFTVTAALLGANVNAEANAGSFASTQTQTPLCSLCPGTYVIRLPHAIAIGDITCQELALTAVFYDDTDLFCGYFREVAKDTCGCGPDFPTPSPTMMPSTPPSTTPPSSPVAFTDNPSSSPLPGPGPGPSPSPSPSPGPDSGPTPQSTPTSSPSSSTFSPQPSISLATTSSPTRIIDRTPNCDGLLSGTYPDITTSASFVDFVFLNFSAELDIENASNIVIQDVMDDFADMGSRYLSAHAGGCFDDGNNNDNSGSRRHQRLLRRGQQQRTLNEIQMQDYFFVQRREASEEESRKVHYIRLTKLVDKGNCPGNLSFSSSTCRVVEGRIGMLYSTASMVASTNDDNERRLSLPNDGTGSSDDNTSTNDDNSSDNNWPEQFVLGMFDSRENDIVSNVDGLQDFRIMSLNLNRDSGGPSSSNGNNNSTIVISLGAAAGFSAILFLFAGFLLRKNNRNRAITQKGHRNGTFRSHDSCSSSNSSNSNTSSSNITPTGLTFPLQNLDSDDLTTMTPFDQGIEVQLVEPASQSSKTKNLMIEPTETDASPSEIAMKCVRSRASPYLPKDYTIRTKRFRSRASSNHKNQLKGSTSDEKISLSRQSQNMESLILCPKVQRSEEDSRVLNENDDNRNNHNSGTKKKRGGRVAKNNAYDAYYNQIIDLLEDVDIDDNVSDFSSINEPIYKDMLQRSNTKRNSNHHFELIHEREGGDKLIPDTVDM